MNTRLTILKTVLWSMMGALAVVTVARFVRGLGATTALTDATPWGFWIAFDVMSGVALAAGGFVLAATVYIFGLEKYRPFVRPAILTAFLGYLAVAVGLLYDLGLPWHIWHPIIYPQHNSVLFEVAMCVMLYLTVLSLEFAPVVLEYSWFDRPIFRWIHKVLKRVTIPLVITGIVLSTLHQSSLGSLFLITPYRLHPLWYSPIIWILFLVSAVGLGLMMVTAESFFSAWFFGHKLRMDLLSGLGKAASVVLFVYAGLRLGDLAWQAAWKPGFLAAAFDGSWQMWLFFFELALSALIPATLLSFRRVRTSAVGLATCAGMTVMGMIGYRFDVCIEAFLRPEDMPYFPSWTELVVSFGIVAGTMLVFIFFVEKLKVYNHEHVDELDSSPRGLDRGGYSPTTISSLLPDSLRGPRRYSLAAVVAAAVTIALLPAALFSEPQLPKTPVFGTRTVDGQMQARGDGGEHEISLVSLEEAASAAVQHVSLLMIDGNRDGRLVLFPHDYHVEQLAKNSYRNNFPDSEGDSPIFPAGKSGQSPSSSRTSAKDRGLQERDTCVTCHHLNMPYDKDTSCSECHRDMYIPSDIFNHALHVEKLGGNHGCAECHRDPTAAKTRESAWACVECHEDMQVTGSLVDAPAGGMKGRAAGYMYAMHGLCVTCHERILQDHPEEYKPPFAECANCHRDTDGTRLKQMKPYLVRQPSHAENRGNATVVSR